MNSYFVENPNMILGKMVMESTQFGMDSKCKANENASLDELLNNAIKNINTTIEDYEVDDITEESDTILADPNVRNFSYAIVDGKLYFRENSQMISQEKLPITTINRIKDLIKIRETVRELIDYQLEDYSDDEIKIKQNELNIVYDKFVKQYGLINSRANRNAFQEDSSYYLLTSLEIIDEEGKLKRKADMFTKRTIMLHKVVQRVDTANEALILSISEKAKVDLDYMSELTGKKQEEIISDLNGIIFKVPNTDEYQNADEYLSGNIRAKLKIAKEAFEKQNDDSNYSYEINIKALEGVMPKNLTSAEISIRLGATWIPEKFIKQFTFELLDTPFYRRSEIKVHFSEFNGEWNIEGKNRDYDNVRAYSTYGTQRINAYKILEETLNLKDVRIFDNSIDEKGNKIRVFNKKETAIAQAKQDAIKQAFSEWIFKDINRREELTQLYNEKFNSIRPREYDGSNINFNGMNPEIKLRQHQLNAIAHILYGGNTLLAHEVGAGKTYEMVSSAMESKRLGLCNKSLFVVPNHIIDQFASDFLQLYPSANLLVATKKDFATNNRKRFCSKIATGEYDAILIGHSQFEKIPMSFERQKIIIQQQIDEAIKGIQDLKENNGEHFSIKQMEKVKKSLEEKLKKLNDQSKKDDVITFEELGVDRIFVDEAHYYKNLFLFTKMRNVGGIAQTEAQKSSDLFMKCRYLDEITKGKGVIFATGTPISNSMVELYTMQRYLQYNELVKNKLEHFDSWASTFGETTTAIELAPEGTGYRAKTRFAKFYNLPELMSMFKEVADIQTADMLKLPVPKANYENIVVKPSEIQKSLVEELSKRAERVRNHEVDASTDNMLKITNDGRKIALDQRLENELLEDFENSKVATCSKNIYRIWEETKQDKLTQLVFCDLSTPNGSGKFNVYDDIKNKLMANGIPKEEIAFIHEADTEEKKDALFSKVRKGDVRVLLGSTQKMGAGTNCQDKLIALHDLDCPWRPSDLIQRSGRIIRQGNQNKEVFIYRYVTEGTFDAYLYQLVENKQKFISQIMTSKTPVRQAEDIDETALSYAEIKALAAGNPLIIEKTQLDADVNKLRLLKQSHLNQIYSLENLIIKYYPNEVSRLKEIVKGLEEDIEVRNSQVKKDEKDFYTMKIKDKLYTDKKEAGQAILDECKNIKSSQNFILGEYRGFEMKMQFDSFMRTFKIILKKNLSYPVEIGTDIFGNISRIDNVLNGLENQLTLEKNNLKNTEQQFENAKIESKIPFSRENELSEKQAKLNEVNAKLNIGEKEHEIVDETIENGNPSNGKNKDNHTR